jgi:phosphoglycolate phosphatase
MSKLIIFDMDGTLFRTETVDLVAINKALERNGFARLSDEEILDLIGITMEEACKIVLGEVEKSVVGQFTEDVIRFEKEEIAACGQLYPGVSEMLEGLKEKGYTLCICSNGDDEYIHAIVDKFDFKKYFAEIWYSHEGITKSQAVGILKQKFEADTFVMVGDRSSDIEAARANGGTSIGVAYGFGQEEPYAADFTVWSIRELYEKLLEI